MPFEFIRLEIPEEIFIKPKAFRKELNGGNYKN